MASRSSARLAYLHNHPERLTDELFSHGCRHSISRAHIVDEKLFCFEVNVASNIWVKPRFDSLLLKWHYSDVTLMPHDGTPLKFESVIRD